METTSIRLPAHLIDAIEKAAARTGVKRSTVVRRAVEQYLRNSGTPPQVSLLGLVDRLVDYPGSGRGDLAQRGEEYLREHFRARRRRPR